ncbi:MAG: 2Fe-2S iron-sulfur cluster-binding protein, partial [Candidatus Binatales bacterium]
MPKVTIDGKQLDASDGINLIDAAERAGIEVPHYCYHP